jgi:diaminopimelate decarboxylase
VTLVDRAIDDPRIEVGPRVAGQEPETLTAAHGSPLFVYDLDAVRARLALLRRVLPGTVDLAFAVKSNPSPEVLSAIAAAGAGADVASAGELRAVLRAGFEPGRIVFTGPGKTDEEIAAALRARIGGLTLESPDEIDTLLDMAPDVAPGQGLLLRLSTVSANEPDPIISASGADKFGLTEDEADDALARLRAVGATAPTGPYVVRGFHAFAASNVRDAATLADAVAHLAARAERLASRHGLSIALLDAGGGLGIPYADGEEPLDIGRLGELLATEMGSWRGRPSLTGTRLLLEPGRWLVGPAGVYLCRVVRTKERLGRTIAVTDGGIHHLLRPRLVGRDHRVVPVGRASERAAGQGTNVVGPLCTGLDVLATDVSLPAVQRGDLLAILDTGAYGYSESMPFFLSHPIPAEIVIDRGAVRVSKERIEPE